MSGSITIPLFLQYGIARGLNNQLIKNNKSFAFLGEANALINKYPSTYAEAFDQFVTGLYILYHDNGMAFLKAYTDQADDKRYTFHVEFVCKCRGAISHSKNENTCNYVYRKLKNYYFYDDSSFKYVDWFDFWYKATEKHWEKLVKKIVKDSDRFYNDYMLLIANHATSLKNVYEKISEVFKIGTYSISDSQINIYEKSLDYRFMKNLCNKVEDSTTWRDESIAKEELKTFYTQGLLSDEEIKKLKEVGKSTPQELKKKLIDKLKVFLVSEHCQDSVIIFKYLHQIIVELIEDQVNAEIISEYKDMLE